MKEGWNNEDYFILFEDTQFDQITMDYGIRKFLPDLTIVAILGWDDFAVRDQAGGLFRVPTVPLVQKYVEILDGLPDPTDLTPDERYTGKIKWYTLPIVFGGDPTSEENVIWIDMPKHQEFVQWWNRMYKDMSGEQ